MRTALLIAPLVLVACGDDSLKILRNPPAVVIQSPLDGQEFAQGDVVEFRGVVDDDGDVTALDVEWLSSIDGPLIDTDAPDPDGNVEAYATTLSEGTHVVTLRAIDDSREQAEDTVTITIMEVPELPSITIDHPRGDERGLEDTPFVFMATVDDYQDPPEGLSVSLSASPLGFVCDMAVDGAGNASCSATLPTASYLLTFEVVDSEGNSAEALAEFDVLSPDDFDFDSDGYSVNAGDCNDSNASIYPGAPEVCDGLDNDCNELTAIDVGTDCYDDDGDRYCERPPCVNTSETLADCDDTNASISPVGREVQNGVDDDCDGLADEGTPVFDDDGDGYCESPPCINATGTTADCNDNDYTINPGATEVCGNGTRQQPQRRAQRTERHRVLELLLRQRWGHLRRRRRHPVLVRGWSLPLHGNDLHRLLRQQRQRLPRERRLALRPPRRRVFRLRLHGLRGAPVHQRDGRLFLGNALGHQLQCQRRGLDRHRPGLWPLGDLRRRLLRHLPRCLLRAVPLRQRPHRLSAELRRLVRPRLQQLRPDLPLNRKPFPEGRRGPRHPSATLVETCGTLSPGPSASRRSDAHHPAPRPRRPRCQRLL